MVNRGDHGASPTVIVGLGVTGLSCARYFAKIGRPFKVVDSRQQPPMLAQLTRTLPDVECELGRFSADTLNAAGELVVSPGVSLDTPEVAAAISTGVPVTGDVDIFSRQVEAPIVAVTGSNGKSTVVAALASILGVAEIDFGLGGNLDGSRFKPVLDLLSEASRDLYVLEVSSFQLETTPCMGAEVATLLNLSADHMDRYRSLDDYHLAKQKIFNGCRQVVINRDDPRSAPAQDLGVPSWDFGLSVPGQHGFGLVAETGSEYLVFESEKIMRVDELKVIGRHNIANMLAASALAAAVGVDLAAIGEGIRRFAGLPHRCQWVRSLHGVSYYNDSKGTNVGATLAAVEGLGEHITGKLTLIMGGVGKGADFQALTPAINRWVRQVILLGRDAQLIGATLADKAECLYADGMAAAVEMAQHCAQEGDAVLLSPACASFDMFDNFQRRGDVFVQAVEELQ